MSDGWRRDVYIIVGLLVILGAFSAVMAPSPISGPTKVENTKALYKWTVMCYLDGDNNLDSYGDEDLSEFQTAGTVPGVAVIILKDDSTTGDSTLWIGADGGSIDQVTTGLPSWWPADNELDMGDVNLLINFLEWCMANYPAEHYWLDMWNHGGSLYGECWDDTDGTNIDLADLVTALETVHQNTGDWIDVISHDECLMAENGVNYNQMLFTNYTVSSEDSIGGDGFEYQNVMPHINNDPNINPADFAIAICQEYYAYYGTSGAYTTLSAINNTLYHHYMLEALNAFGQKLMHKAGTLNAEITTARDNAASWQATAGYDFDSDMVDFCYQIQAQIPESTDAEIYRNASRLIDIADPDADGAGVIMMHNQNAGEYGIKSYIEDGTSYKTDYDMSRITVETNWDDFVKAMLSSTDYPNEEPIIEMLTPINGTKIYSSADIPNINSTTVYGVVNISGTISDPDAAPPYDTTVYRVEICIDRDWWNTTAVTLASDGTWWYNWDSLAVPEGWHHIMVRAYDGQDWSVYYEHVWLYVVHNTPPTVSITYPSENDILSGTETITYSASDNEDGTALTIDIYYREEGSSTWTALVTGTSNTGSYSWDTTTVADGQYYLKVVATDSQGVKGEDVSGPFWIDNEPSPPAVTITSPVAGDVLTPGATYTIQYNAYDQDPTGSISSIDIEVSYDGGITWTTVATGLSNTGTYDWAVPEGYCEDVYIRVRATDNDGMTGDATEGPIKIASQLYFQVQQSGISTYENLTFEPLESAIYEKEVQCTSPGEALIGVWITNELAKDYNVKGVWEFMVYGRKTGTIGGFFMAKVYDYNAGSPVLLFTAQDDENVSLYTDYHAFTWTYNYSGYVVPQGSRVMVEIYLNATEAVPIDVQAVGNPTFDADSTGWTVTTTSSDITADFSSTEGNPAGSIYVSIYDFFISPEGTATWETTFNYDGIEPTSVTLSFDRYVSSFSANTVNQYTIYLVDPASNVYTIYPTTAYTAADTSWVSVKDYAVNTSYFTMAGTYTLQIYVEISAARRGTTTIYFDNIYLNISAPAKETMGYDAPDTPSYVVMPTIPAHTIYGYVYYADGTTPVPNAEVVLTDARTGLSMTVYTDSNGYYQAEISTLSYLSGDEITVTASDASTGGTGSASATVDTSTASQQVDVLLNTTVPELTPFVALCALAVAFVAARRRRNS